MDDGFYRARYGGQEMVPSAVIPPPAAAPPPPPPVASGAVAQRSTVDVTGAVEALVVGPTDVLIVSFPEHMTMGELYEMRDRMRDSDLRDGQILLIAGADKMVKVQQDAPRTYVRPHATVDVDVSEVRGT